MNPGASAIAAEFKLSGSGTRGIVPAESFVVVFPSIFPKRQTPALVRNIKRMLKVHGEPYTSMGRDGEVILVDAHDPVFASSAICLLFGVEKVLIARRTGKDSKEIAAMISEVGGRLLLRGERFMVKVEGASKGFLPRDVEMDATSRIIETRSELGARPGTAENHDKVLYAYMSRRHAYVSMFTDTGLGGQPWGVQGKAVACIYDEISAASCFEAIALGFDTNIIVCYRKKSELLHLSKMLDRMAQYVPEPRFEVSFYHIRPAGSSYMDTAALAVEMAIGEAAGRGITHVVLPISRMISPGEASETLAGRVSAAGLKHVTPLYGGQGRLFKVIKELNLAGKTSKVKAALSKSHAQPGAADPQESLASRRTITIKAGPNRLHEILDTLQ